jgi:cell wall-associated NlpC family hydrolase
MHDPRRAAVVKEAETWLRTQYHHMGRKKGAGTDCLMLLAEVYEAAVVIPHIDVPFYPPDWNLHRDAERYLAGVMEHAREFSMTADPEGALVTKPMPEPGDVAVFKFGRCYAHGVIVTNWPLLIHSWVNGGVLRGDATQPPLLNRPVRFFDPFFSSKVA